MVRFGPGLERKQAVLGRIVEIGSEIFVMVATCTRAQVLVRDRPTDRSPYTLANLFCLQARERIDDRFRRLFRNNDASTYDVAQEAMKGTFSWVEEGMVDEDWVSPTEGPVGGSDSGEVELASVNEGEPEPASTG
jgi:hypothetical protein